MPAKFGRDRLKGFGLASGPTWLCAIHSCSRPYHALCLALPRLQVIDRSGNLLYPCSPAQPKRRGRFSRAIAQTTCSDIRKCLLGGLEYMTSYFGGISPVSYTHLR